MLLLLTLNMCSTTRYGIKAVCKGIVFGEPTSLISHIKIDLGYALFTLLLFGNLQLATLHLIFQQDLA